VVAVLLAWFLLKEQITLRVVAGMILILTGLVVVARK
jgi:transporter family protein